MNFTSKSLIGRIVAMWLPIMVFFAWLRACCCQLLRDPCGDVLWCERERLAVVVLEPNPSAYRQLDWRVLPHRLAVSLRVPRSSGARSAARKARPGFLSQRRVGVAAHGFGAPAAAAADFPAGGEHTTCNVLSSRP